MTRLPPSALPRTADKHNQLAAAALQAIKPNIPQLPKISTPTPHDNLHHKMRHPSISSRPYQPSLALPSHVLTPTSSPPAAISTPSVRPSVRRRIHRGGGLDLGKVNHILNKRMSQHVELEDVLQHHDNGTRRRTSRAGPSSPTRTASLRSCIMIVSMRREREFIRYRAETTIKHPGLTAV